MFPAQVTVYPQCQDTEVRWPPTLTHTTSWAQSSCHHILGLSLILVWPRSSQQCFDAVCPPPAWGQSPGGGQMHHQVVATALTAGHHMSPASKALNNSTVIPHFVCTTKLRFLAADSSSSSPKVVRLLLSVIKLENCLLIAC